MRKWFRKFCGHNDTMRNVAEIRLMVSVINEKVTGIMVKQTEIEQGLKDVLAQQTKTQGEIVVLQQSVTDLKDLVAKLEVQVNDGDASQGVIDALAAVRVKTQEVDDLIPDVPAPAQPKEMG